MIDTHCHIQDTDYDLDFAQELEQSVAAGVNELILIGCTRHNSRLAAERALENANCYAIIGIHPHYSSDHPNAAADLAKIIDDFGNKVIGIGEIGLDYWYLNSDKESQRAVLAQQMEFAVERELPLNFHIRGSRDQPHDAFDDAWPIIDGAGVNAGGVVHSFTGDIALMEQCLVRGFYLGFNGILTFTKDEKQIEMLKSAPLDRIVLETDAPFLAPQGKRGEQNTPANIPVIAELLAEAREEDVEEFIAATTANAKKVYGI